MASVGAAKKAAVKERPKKAASATTAGKARTAAAAKTRVAKKQTAKSAKTRPANAKSVKAKAAKTKAGSTKVNARSTKAKAGRGRKAVQELLELEAQVREWVCGWDFEMEAWAEGSRWVAGVDEVGRGPLFGPVVAAAVVLPADEELRTRLAGLNDSKQLTEEERERFDELVRGVALAWAVAEVDVETIDRINILQASKLAMKIAVESLRQRGCEPDHLLIDGNQKIDAVCRQRTIVQGDARSMSIAAASVIAKVHRDRLLRELDARYPGYGLAQNKGYATPEHREALQRLGVTDLHRRSFAPVAARFELEIETIDVELGLELNFDLIEE